MSEQARTNMIKQQLRTIGVVDEKLLNLFEHIPRELFVPEDYELLAFADTNIPLDEHHVMPTPKVEAQMLQALEVQPTDTVLEIGTGSGYVTAMLSQLAKQVTSVDLNTAFSAAAKQRLDKLHIQNVSLEIGDALMGWPAHAPYDVIAVQGSMLHLPDELCQQLQVGGRLFIFLGQAPAMIATLVTRVSEEEWNRHGLFETVVPPLQTFETSESFYF